MTCTDPHVQTCAHCVRNMEEPVYLVRLEDGCDAGYLCTDCQKAWETAWRCEG